MPYVNLFLFGDKEKPDSARGSSGSAEGDKSGENNNKKASFDESETQNNEDAASSDTALDSAKDSRDREKNRAEFEKLIKGRYKEAFAERTQQIINSRFRQMKELEEQLAKSRANEELLQRELVDISLSRHNELAATEYKSWLRDAEMLRNEYPDFDLEKEAKDQRFIDLLKSGVDLRSAYTALHSDLVIASALERERSKMLSSIIERSSRPDENGTSDQSTAVGKPDISALSRSEIASIEKRVARGEKIYLK